MRIDSSRRTRGRPGALWFVGLVAAWCVACSRGSAEPTAAPSPRAAATAWLLAQQAEDGSWRGLQYGLLRSGQSLTAFVLAALHDDPGGGADAAQTRARAFLREQLRDGGLGLADATAADYPTYATALYTGVLERQGRHDSTLLPGVAWLLGRQFGAAGHWKPDHPAYGGWGMGHVVLRPPADPGHLDISMTRHALQALAAHSAVDDAVRDRAMVFLGRCQDFDPEASDAGSGGFWFSPVVLDRNKAGEVDGRFRPYGTTTADGVLALLACGLTPENPRVRAAHRWLLSNHSLDGVPGIPKTDTRGWDQAMWFYYCAAVAEVFAHLGGPDGWAAEMQAALASRQRPDGAFANAHALMKEDEPVIATTLALRALHAIAGSELHSVPSRHVPGAGVDRDRAGRSAGGSGVSAGGHD